MKASSTLSRPIKIVVRLLIALFGAIFGSLMVSVSTCSYAARRSDWPHWADFVCGHNVGFLWLLSGPVLFLVLIFVLSKGFARFRRHTVVMLLAVYGVYGLVESVGAHPWWITTLFPAATLAAAVGVAVRQRWARFLVYALAFVFVAQWVYYVCLAANSGYFRQSGLGQTLLSLMPGAAFLLLAAFCCYGVTVQRSSESGSHPSSLS